MIFRRPEGRFGHLGGSGGVLAEVLRIVDTSAGIPIGHPVLSRFLHPSCVRPKGAKMEPKTRP